MAEANPKRSAAITSAILISFIHHQACLSKPITINTTSLAQAEHCFRLPYGSYGQGSTVCQELPLKSMAEFVVPNTSIADAVGKGCRDQGDLSVIYENALSNIDPINRVTINALSNESWKTNTLSGGKTTKYYVTAPGTYLYRGLTIPRELKWMLEHRTTYSKYINALYRQNGVLDQNGPYVLPYGIWPSNNPEVTPINHTSLSLILQIHGINSTDQPKSQFSSFALRRELAESYAQNPPDDYVYLFVLNPQSPVLGLQQCNLNIGEVQLQVPGGTYIEQLQRAKVRSNDWEVYNWEIKEWQKPKPFQHW